MRDVDFRVLASGLLTLVCALFMTLIAFSNITDYGTNKAFVVGVLEMDTTFRDPDVMWRAIDASALQNVAYIAVIVVESLAAVALWVALARLWQVRTHGDPTQALRWVTCGTLLIVAIFGIGFTAIGGEYFSMWQSSQWNGLEAALRYFAYSFSTLLYSTLALGQLRRERGYAPSTPSTPSQTVRSSPSTPSTPSTG